MKKLLPLLCLICTFSCLLFMSSCGSDDGDASTLTTMTISASVEGRLDIGETTTLTVSAKDQSNQAFTITTTITWSASNANVTVDQNGLVTAVAAGTSTVTAATEGVQATFEVTVWDSSAPRTEIWVSDAGTGPGNPPFQILKYDENGENPEVFTTQNLAWPQDIVFLEDQNTVLVSNLNTNQIDKYNINTGQYLGAFAGGISGPTRMKIGPDNTLYVLQWSGSGHVLRFQLDGTALGQFTSVGVNQSIGLDWDTNGNLYVSSFNGGNGGSVRKFNDQGVDQGLFINSNLTGPTDIWFDQSGNLWVNDWQQGVVRRFDADGNFINNAISGVGQVEGADFLPNGNLLIGHGQGASIKMYTPTGAFIENLVPSGRGGLRQPNAVIVREVN